MITMGQGVPNSAWEHFSGKQFGGFGPIGRRVFHATKQALTIAKV